MVLRRAVRGCLVVLWLGLSAAPPLGAQTPAVSSARLFEDGRGTKVGDQLFLLNTSGQKVLASDGIYRSKDGKQYVVRAGKIASIGPFAAEPPRGQPPAPGGPAQTIQIPSNPGTVTKSMESPGGQTQPGVKGQIQGAPAPK